MHYVGRRSPRSFTSPLQSLPLYRTVESALGVSPQVKARAELRIARAALVAETARFAKDRAALGKANRCQINWGGDAGPGCRRWHQAEAMHNLKPGRRMVRAATRRVEAAEPGVGAMLPSYSAALGVAA